MTGSCIDLMNAYLNCKIRLKNMIISEWFLKGKEIILDNSNSKEEFEKMFKICKSFRLSGEGEGDYSNSDPEVFITFTLNRTEEEIKWYFEDMEKDANNYLFRLKREIEKSNIHQSEIVSYLKDKEGGMELLTILNN